MRSSPSSSKRRRRTTANYRHGKCSRHASSKIAQYVSEGMTTRESSEKAFVSHNTAKQHIKRIFAKTGVHSRAELVQMIWASPWP